MDHETKRAGSYASRSHPPASRDWAEGEEMIQSEPKSDSDLTVCVRRHPSGGPTAVYRFSDIDGFHWDRVSEGVGRETSHDALFGYVMCDGAVSGATRSGVGFQLRFGGAQIVAIEIDSIIAG